MKWSVSVVVSISAVLFLTISAQAESKVEIKPENKLEIKGEQVFSRKCAMCHVVKGKGGAIGPELTKVFSRMKESDLRVQIENPKIKNPSSSMPSYRSMYKPDLDALMAYLKTLK